MSNNALLVIGVVLLVVITAGLTYYITQGSQTLPPLNESGEVPTITVRGEATRTLDPDLLTVTFSIESLGNSTAESQSQSADDTADVKAALLAAGVKAEEIETASYYTYPVYNESCYSGCYYYDYAYPAEGMVDEGMMTEPAVAYPDMMPPRCKQECEIVGYKTVHTIRVESGETTEGGDMVDAALGASDAVKVDYIYFSLTESTRLEAESELQAEAAAAARTKAQNIASGLGAGLGKIVSINPDHYYPYPMYAYESSVGMADSSPVPTEIFPTDTTLYSSITVVYELEQ